MLNRKNLSLTILLLFVLAQFIIPEEKSRKEIAVLLLPETRSDWFLLTEENILPQSVILEVARLSVIDEMLSRNPDLKLDLILNPSVLKTADLLNTDKIQDKYFKLLLKDPSYFTETENDYFYENYFILPPFSDIDNIPVLNELKQKVIEKGELSKDDKKTVQALNMYFWSAPYLFSIGISSIQLNEKGNPEEKWRALIRDNFIEMFKEVLKKTKKNIFEDRLELGISPFLVMNIDLFSLSPQTCFLQDYEANIVRAIEIYAGYFGLLPKGYYFSERERSRMSFEAVKNKGFRFVFNNSYSGINKCESIIRLGENRILEYYINSMAEQESGDDYENVVKKNVQDLNSTFPPDNVFIFGSNNDFNFYTGKYLSKMEDLFRAISESGLFKFLPLSRLEAGKYPEYPSDSAGDVILNPEIINYEKINKFKKMRTDYEKYKNLGLFDMEEIDTVYSAIYKLENPNYFINYADSETAKTVADRFNKLSAFVGNKIQAKLINKTIPEEIETEKEKEKIFSVELSSSGFLMTDLTDKDYLAVSSGPIDVISFGGKAEEKRDIFTITLSTISNRNNLPYGFSPYYFEIYIDINKKMGAGRKKIFLSKYLTTSGLSQWEYVLKISGEKGTLETISGNKTKVLYTLKENDINIKNNKIKISIPIEHLKGDIKAWSYILLMSFKVPGKEALFSVSSSLSGEKSEAEEFVIKTDKTLFYPVPLIDILDDGRNSEIIRNGLMSGMEMELKGISPSEFEKK